MTDRKYKEYKIQIGDAGLVFFSDENSVAESQQAPSPMHTHKYCELFCVLRGQVKIQTEGSGAVFGEGDCVLIPEELPHTSEICKDSQRVAISFLMKKTEKRDQNGYFSQLENLFSKDMLIFRDFIGAEAFQRLARYYYSSFSERDELVLACLHEIIMLMKTSAEQKLSTTRPKELFDDSSYRNYIISNYFNIPKETKNLKGLSEQLNLSCQQTQRIIKKLYGQTFQERMIHSKMSYAKRLLLTTDMPLSQIAPKAGYTCVHGFLNTFKKQFGITPNQYRKANKKSQS